jgi:hypothetical protein
VLVVNGTGALKNNRDVFKNEVSKMQGVKGSSYADIYLFQVLQETMLVFLPAQL